MPYQLRSDELDSSRVIAITKSPELQKYLLSLQEDLRGMIAYIAELESRVEDLESP